jgi:hypothetical protein
MKGDFTIGPGLCQEEECPAPIRIECIAVDKVYDSCFQTENLPAVLACIVVDQDSVTPDMAIPCNIEDAVISCIEIERRPLNSGLFEVDLLFKVENIKLQNPKNPQETLPLKVIPFVKTVTLCCPEGTMVDCSESRVNRCLCNIAEVKPVVSNPTVEIEVICQVQLC